MPEPTPEDVKASYGFVALLGDAVPEIKNLLVDAIKNKWTPDRFVMSVANTNWWKTTPASTREWVIKNATDPASAEADLKAGASKLGAELSQMGAGGLGPDPTGWLRESFVALKAAGIDADEVARRQFIWNRYMSSPYVSPGLNLGGQHAQLVRDAFRMAKEYGYQSTDLSGEVLRWVNGAMAAGGVADIGGWQSGMINYAESKFAPYADDIRGGKTVAEIARPIVDRVAGLLEVNPDSINFDDPLMKKALTEWGAENRAYSLNEIENFARQDSRWKTTDNAMESSVKLLNELGQTFGFLGGR